MKDILYFNLGDYPGADISGEDYRNLINYCFNHCAALSFSFNGENDSAEYLPDFLPFATISLLPDNFRRENGIIWLQHKSFYPLSDSLRNFLLKKAQSLFDWKLSGTKPIPEPEDLCFYRKDGSGMFWSCTHEGECAFFLRRSEAQPPLASNYGWELLRSDHPYYEGLVELGQELRVEYGSGSKRTEDGSAHFGFSARISIE